MTLEVNPKDMIDNLSLDERESLANLLIEWASDSVVKREYDGRVRDNQIVEDE